MRMIDATDLKEHFRWSEKYRLSIKEILSIIDDAPTADDWQKYSDELWKNAYERGKQDAKTTGEWYHSCEKGWECSQCHEVVKNMPTVMRKAKYHFCPNCGADMGKE